MRAGEILYSEHEKIGVSLFILENILKKMEVEEKIPFSDFDNIILFLQEFADFIHHKKEEDFYFPEVIKTGDLKLKSLVLELIEEHKKARELVNEFKIGVSELKSGGGKNKIKESILNYISLMKKHIGKENGILFIQAGKIFDEKIDGKIAAGFLRIDEKVKKDYFEMIFQLSIRDSST